jgi:glycosyltransferase involved in cell wall biosynthesis
MNTVKRRLAVVSPFLDKSHGTERMVVEWISHLADDFEIHVYSQDVEDIDLSKVVWHRIPKLKGPHLLNYLWWFLANHVCRAWNRARGLNHDLIFSPGINCLDPDAVSVHIVFAEFVRRIRPELAFARNSVSSWPRLIHRRLYYHLIIFLEGIVFRNPRIQLILTAAQSGAEIERFYGRRGDLPVVSAGLDHVAFNPERCLFLRVAARAALGLGADRFAILLVGNDWRKKGLLTLLGAMRELSQLPVDILVVGRDDPGPFGAFIHDNKLEGRVHFLPQRKDVEFYYAAADVYAGPSLEDTFALPAAEAMACGLPVIISARAGASELITNGINGLILDDPTNAESLAAMIRGLNQDVEFRARLGRAASETARKCTWERSSRELAAIFNEVLRRKTQFAGHSPRNTRGSATR